jgi:hypothetical protein
MAAPLLNMVAVWAINLLSLDILDPVCLLQAELLVSLKEWDRWEWEERRRWHQAGRQDQLNLHRQLPAQLF